MTEPVWWQAHVHCIRGLRFVGNFVTVQEALMVLHVFLRQGTVCGETITYGRVRQVRALASGLVPLSGEAPRPYGACGAAGGGSA